MASEIELDGIVESAWVRVAAAITSRGDAMRTPVLGTSGPAGASIRTVVLRAADPGRREIVCYTDLRSPKVAQIRADRRVSWLFYDPAAELQLRWLGRAVVETASPVADRHWQAVPPARQLDYGSPASPGAPPGEAGGSAPSPRTNFAVLVSRVHHLDWLELRPAGHRRARCRYADGAWQATWITP